MKHVVRTRKVYDDKYTSLWSELWLLPGAPREVVDAVYKTLAKKYHPDTGEEDVRAMTRLNEAYRQLRRLTEEDCGRPT